MSSGADDAALLEQLLARRHSCRAFQPHPVPPETIRRMLAIAQRTASWCNTQPWQVYVTQSAGTERVRAALQAAARADGPDNNAGSDVPFPEAYSGERLARRREAGFQLYGAVGVARGDPDGAARQALRNFDLFDAPHTAIVTAPRELGTYGAMDCAAWVSNCLLAAQALGLGAIAQAAVARQSAVLRQELGIPEDKVVLCGVSFGYADAGHSANSYRTSREVIDAAVSWVSA